MTERSPEVSTERLEAHVRALAEEFIPRDYRHTGNLNRAAAYIFAELERAGGRVTELKFTVGEPLYRNVIAAFGPEEGERIVVGAHYDAAGAHPAADDNASGVAGLIELGGLLGRSPPPVRVDLVAYTLEERSFSRRRHLGSGVHAKWLREKGVQVRAMMSLEMIGYFSDAPESQRYPFSVMKPFFPSRGNFITVVGRTGEGQLVRRVTRAMRRASPLPVRSLAAPWWVRGVDFSDHRSFWKHGYPAVMITDTAFFRNPNYHSASDTPDTLDYARMANVVQGVHAAILRLA